MKIKLMFMFASGAFYTIGLHELIDKQFGDSIFFAALSSLMFIASKHTTHTDKERK